MDDILQILSYTEFHRVIMYRVSNFTEVYIQFSNWQHVSICSDNGLRQIVHWYIYALPGDIGLSWWAGGIHAGKYIFVLISITGTPICYHRLSEITACISKYIRRFMRDVISQVLTSLAVLINPLYSYGWLSNCSHPLCRCNFYPCHNLDRCWFKWSFDDTFVESRKLDDTVDA